MRRAQVRRDGSPIRVFARPASGEAGQKPGSASVCLGDGKIVALSSSKPGTTFRGRVLGAFIGAIGLSVALSSCGSGSASSGTQTGPEPVTGGPTNTGPEQVKEPAPPPPPPPPKMYSPRYERKPVRISARSIPRTARSRNTRLRKPRIYAGLDDVLRRARPLKRPGKTELADKEAELKKYLADQKKARKNKRKGKRKGKRKRRVKKPRGKTSKGALDKARKTGALGALRQQQKEMHISLVHDLASIRFNAYRWGRLEEEKLLDRIRTTRSYYLRRRLRVELQKKMEESKKLQAEAEAGYKKLLAQKKIAKYSKLDEALFDSGLLHHLAGQADKTKPLWERLLKEASDSKLIPLVQLALAEQAFEKNAMAEAESLYEQAGKNSPRHGFLAAYLAYKLGWVQHRLNQPPKALKSFYEAYRRSRYRRNLRKLNESAMRGFVRTYATNGDPDKAYNTFRSLDYRRAFEMVQLLSNLYRRQGKSKEALGLAREMLRRQSDHVLACNWQLDVALDTIRSGDRKAQIEALDSWVKVYISQRDRYGLIPPTEIGDCHNAAQRVASAVTRSLHLDAQKSGSDADWKAAVAMYDKYLSIWPKATDAAEMRYYLADLHWRVAAKPTAVDKAIGLWSKLTSTYDVMLTARNYYVRRRARTAGAMAHANLAAIYADASLGKSNKKQALDHYRKACEYRHRPSCEEADRISGKKKPPPADAKPPDAVPKKAPDVAPKKP